MILLLQRHKLRFYGLSPALFTMGYARSIPLSQHTRWPQQGSKCTHQKTWYRITLRFYSHDQALPSTGRLSHFGQLISSFQSHEVVISGVAALRHVERGCRNGAGEAQVLAVQIEAQGLLMQTCSLEQVYCSFATGNEKMQTKKVLTQNRRSLALAVLSPCSRIKPAGIHTQSLQYFISLFHQLLSLLSTVKKHLIIHSTSPCTFGFYWHLLHFLHKTKIFISPFFFIRKSVLNVRLKSLGMHIPKNAWNSIKSPEDTESLFLPGQKQHCTVWTRSEVLVIC